MPETGLTNAASSNLSTTNVWGSPSHHSSFFHKRRIFLITIILYRSLSYRKDRPFGRDWSNILRKEDIFKSQRVATINKLRPMLIKRVCKIMRKNIITIWHLGIFQECRVAPNCIMDYVRNINVSWFPSSICPVTIPIFFFLFSTVINENWVPQFL